MVAFYRATGEKKGGKKIWIRVLKGETKTVEFKFNPRAPGKYTITVGTLSVQMIVAKL